jgi:adhesin/invasin
MRRLASSPRLRHPLFASLTVLVAVAACDSTTTTATGTPTATGIGVLGGSAQSAPFGSALPVPLQVHVTDQYGNSIAGVVVTFTPSGGASVGNTTATTDASGDAQTTATLGTTVGADTVVASVSGADVPARFTEFSLAGPATAITVVSGDNQSGTSGTALALPFVILVNDTQGHPVAGDTVTWTAATGTLTAVTTVTAADGTTQNTFTPALGANSVTAAVNNTALTTTFTATGN